MQERSGDADIQNGLVGEGKMGQMEKVVSTYIHFYVLDRQLVRSCYVTQDV